MDLFMRQAYNEVTTFNLQHIITGVQGTELEQTVIREDAKLTGVTLQE